ncbi:N-acetylmuramoyl-L-alanine amidase [Proteiniclasticum sp.]|uniref:N-acetylmuramoyl-L-alanine amidase n=1 Tax=Proteiniclasticum sp. TaxID=2053595 RepID=UPI00289FF8E9|nr:N-acetylmuramoyl-L-alanine amidase [Proteiniclasticum sp.]
MKRKQSISVILFLFLFVMSVAGCGSDKREELNRKLEEGEVLLSQEKYDEAVIFFEGLFNAHQDSISIMEKLDYSRVMSASRQHLDEALRLLEEEHYQEVYEALSGVSSIDEKGQLEKDKIFSEIRSVYVDRAEKLSDARLFKTAMKELDEYLAFVTTDFEVEEMKTDILAKSMIPLEPVVEEVKKIIVINPGHQAVQDKEKEPLGPDSTKLKNRVSSGTRGVASGVYEYVLNLQVSLKLRDELVKAGYEVIMTRTTHEVSISNRERAEMANEKGADLFISIHANGSENRNKKGIMTIYPSKENPYVSHLSDEFLKLSTVLHEEMIKASGAESAGVQAMDNMVTLNWSKVPATIVELGYMSNNEEDLLLNTEEYQDKLVVGLVNGINRYLDEKTP